MANSRVSDMRAIPRLGLNRVELALAIGVSPASVDLMVKEGALPPPRKWHTRKIFIVAEVEAALLDWPSDAPIDPLDDEDPDAWAMTS